MQMNKPMSLSSSAPDYDHQHQQSDDFVDNIGFEFSKCLQLDNDNDDDCSDSLREDESQEEFHECEEEEEYEEEDDENDGDFTFMYVGHDDAPISPGKVFEDGQIRPVFPLFDQNLLLADVHDVDGRNRLPTRPPVDKVFIESPHHGTPSTSSGAAEIEGVAMGPYCTWSKESATSTPELSKKSNSTGFSKLWRFRDKVSRSNSDGRDAFVFLNNPNRPTTSSATSSSSKPAAGDRSSVMVNVAGGAKPKVVRKVAKAKKSPAIAAHEVYLRHKADEERRRSYLPYRPELMGFFTNVNGGLSRNVHPF